MGRLSGHVPQQGELTPEIVEEIILKAVGEQPTDVQPPKIKPRRPSLCPGCPHRPSFYTMRQVFDQAVFSGDIGCYTLGINMGQSTPAFVWGPRLAWRGGWLAPRSPTARPPLWPPSEISTFYHAGVPALINAVHTHTPFVLMIMDNSIAAMTGGEPTPANDSGRRLSRRRD